MDLLRRGVLVALLLAIPVLLALASQLLAERPAAPAQADRAAAGHR